tara:strand:+ start:10667 stop:10822 length:156 start_codon:yes stop_codon:yes gene_type:complete
MQLIVSEDERATGALTPTSLCTVLRDLNDQGFATLWNAVPPRNVLKTSCVN